MVYLWSNMKKIDRETVQKILDAADIVEVVSDFVSLKRRGANYIGLCPFHNERTPSFSVSKSKGICNCFSCGKGGSPVNFLMELEQLSYNEALRYLARKYNIEIKEHEMSDVEREAANEREALLAVNDFACKHFENNLWNTTDGKEIGHSYFRERGLSDEIMKRFRLGYAIDCYRGKYPPEKNPLKYALFVSFFPTMTTGPIERYPHFRPQIHKSRRFSYTRCAGGAFRMLWGYTKKMVLADNMNLYIKMVYDTPAEMNGPNLVAATLLFSLRLYLDFSGCCDIAIGAARILGYDLLENFHSPFEATSFAGLWQRWHMSLTGWLRAYIYIPLGGSRCNVVRHMLNTLIVFAVSGLWHGADLRYLEWGIACGVISVIAQLSKAPRKVLWRYNPLYREPAVQTFLQRCITYLLFSFTMVFFASAIYNAAPGEVFAGILQGWQGGFAAGWESVTNLVTSSGIDGRLPVVLTCGTAIVLAMEHNGNNVARWIRKQCFVLRWTVYYAAAVSILFFAAFGQSAFIYQQF